MNQLKQDLRNAFTMPPAERKKEFLQELNYPKVTMMNFIRLQIGYIRKRVWCLSVAMYIFVILGGKMLTNYENGLLLLASAILPLLALVTATEVFRSMSFRMAELEMSTRYNLATILMVRMTILMSSNLIILIAILPFAGKNGSYGYIKTGIYMIAPYLFTCLLTLIIINVTKGRNTIGCCIAASSFISGVYFIIINGHLTVFTESYYPYWVIACVAFVIITGREIWKINRNAKEYIWNLSLTE